MSETDFPEPSPAQALLLMRVRRMMFIAGATTVLAIAAVLTAIGYRLSTFEGSASGNEITVALPKGARIAGTAAAGDQLVVTVEKDGTTEIRTFDPKTLRPSGTLKFINEP